MSHQVPDGGWIRHKNPGNTAGKHSSRLRRASEGRFGLMKVIIGSALLVTSLGLTGCDALSGAKGDDDDKKSEPSKKGKTAKKKKLADAADPDSSGDAPTKEDTVACGPLSSIPTIPSSRSRPPTLDEWGSACEVNTQGAGSHPGDCTMKIKREWLQVTCRGKVGGYENFEGFGNEGADYFKQIRTGEMASFVVRLRKGKSQKVRICRGRERASLFVSWPPSSAKPLHVALGIGPGCERNRSFKTK
jgi:hypothetical protein